MFLFLTDSLLPYVKSYGAFHNAKIMGLLQGKAKDSGWGSDDEAAPLSAPVADDDSEANPSGPKVAKKQVASAFDILDEDSEQQDDPASDLDESKPVNGKTGKLHDEDSNDDDSSSDEGEQVNMSSYIYLLLCKTSGSHKATEC